MRKKLKSLVPFYIYFLLSFLIWCFFYMTEIGGLASFLAMFTLWPVYFTFILWLPYITGKLGQRIGHYSKIERIFISFLNGILYGCIMPFVELLGDYVSWKHWNIERFIEKFNPMSPWVDWYNYFLMVITFLFYLIGAEVQKHREKM